MNFNLKANISSTPFNIPEGVYLAGYGHRDKPNIGTHDALHTKAVTISNGEKTIMIISNDLLGVNEEIVKRVVNGIKEGFDILEENIFICATHTHAAPDIFDWEFDKRYSQMDLNKEAKEIIINTIIENGLKSTKDLKPVQLAFGQSKGEGIASNRIDKNALVDNLVSGIFLIGEDNLPLCTMVNYACHPTVLGAENLYISRDYPGVTQSLVEDHFGKDSICMFMNGACGNQSTRFTRRSQDFHEVERMGEILFESVLKAYDNRIAIEDSTISVVKEYFQFPRKQLPSREEAEAYYQTMTEKLNMAKRNLGIAPEELRGIITKHQGAGITLELLEVLDDLNLNAPIQLVRLGNLVFVGVPVELFNDYGFLIKEKSKFPNTIIVGYTNGMLGYVYTPQSYEVGDYEAWSSPFHINTGEKLVEKVINLMEEL